MPSNKMSILGNFQNAIGTRRGDSLLLSRIVGGRGNSEETIEEQVGFQQGVIWGDTC